MPKTPKPSAFLDWLVDWNTVLSFVLLGFIVVGALLTGLTTIGSIASSHREAVKVLTLQRELAEAREKTAKAEESVIQLRKFTLGSRHISKEARPKMEEILSKGAKGTVSVTFSEANNLEPRFFAAELEGLLKKCGWTIEKAKEGWRTMPAFAVTMVHFGFDEKAQPEGKFVLPAHVKALDDAFAIIQPECGKFQFGGGGVPDLDECSVLIIVGPKF